MSTSVVADGDIIAGDALDPPFSEIISNLAFVTISVIGPSIVNVVIAQAPLRSAPDTSLHAGEGDLDMGREPTRKRRIIIDRILCCCSRIVGDCGINGQRLRSIVVENDLRSWD